MMIRLFQVHFILFKCQFVSIIECVLQNYADVCQFEYNSDKVSQQSTFTFVCENLSDTSGSADCLSAILYLRKMK